MSDPTQNPRPQEGPTPSSRPSEPPPSEPTHTESSSAPPPPPPPSQGQGSYGPGYSSPPGGTGQQSGWQQPGAMPPAPGAPRAVGQPADVMPRFLARLIDYILLAVVEGIIGAIIFGIAFGINGGLNGSFTGFGIGTGTTYAANAVSAVVNAVIALGYFSLMETKLGQTVGKMVVKLETRGPGGGHPTFEQAVKRNAWVAVGVLGAIPFLGFVGSLLWLVAVITIAVTISNHPSDRHGWHDDFAGGTTVYKVG